MISGTIAILAVAYLALHERSEPLLSWHGWERRTTSIVLEPLLRLWPIHHRHGWAHFCMASPYRWPQQSIRGQTLSLWHGAWWQPAIVQSYLEPSVVSWWSWWGFAGNEDTTLHFYVQILVHMLVYGIRVRYRPCFIPFLGPFSRLIYYGPKQGLLSIAWNEPPLVILRCHRLWNPRPLLYILVW